MKGGFDYYIEKCSHISLLFVMKEYHCRDIATKLFNELKKEIMKNNPSIELITVNSSPFEVKVYQRLGFVAANKEMIQDGLKFILMKYMI